MHDVGLHSCWSNQLDSAYRELFYTAPTLGDSISGTRHSQFHCPRLHTPSGAILFDETLYQATSNGQPFVETLRQQGILAGIKVDKVCSTW